MAVLFTGCYKVDIYNTEHPKTGKLTLITDWTNRTDGAAIPASYTAELVAPATKASLTGTIAEYPSLLVPGTYTLYLYNTTDEIVVNGTTATVAVVGSGIAPQPGCVFWSVATENIEADKDYSTTVVMQQITRQLLFDLTITEGDPTRITSITATFYGVAGAWNCETDMPIGEPTVTIPVFARAEKRLTAMVQLLGVVGKTQILTLNLVFNDGHVQQIVTDLSVQLTSFNSDKTQPACLMGDVKAPIYTEYSGNINDWTPGNDSGESGTAENVY